MTGGVCLNIANVMERFVILSGIDKSECAHWQTVVDDACDYIEAHSLIKEPNHSQMKRLEMLSAAYAYRLYCRCNDNNITSFTAGEVKIISRGGNNRAETLWKELAAKSKDLIENEEFLFGRVM